VQPVATAEPGRFPVALDDAWRALGDVVTGVYSTTGCLRALLEKLAQHCGTQTSCASS